MTAKRIAGWDIGGAHLKAALVEDGEIVAMRQIACPLWLGEEHLLRAWDEAGDAFTGADFHAITMTGELAEIFPSREAGVGRIIALAEEKLRGERLYYAGRFGFLGAREALAQWQAVASANWRASGELTAQFAPYALFIDIGSTTTDIVPLGQICEKWAPVFGKRSCSDENLERDAGSTENHRASGEGAVWARGESDASRLLVGELVYTGAIRTSLMALGERAPFAGHFYPLMAENFSTSADLYRLTGELDAADDLYPASDGRSKSAEDSMARLARMIGLDAETGSAEHWLQLARHFRELQLRRIHDAAAQVLSASIIPGDAPIVGAGAGHFLASALAERLGRPYLDFGALIPAQSETRHLARTCAPAASTALLLARKL
jgi:uncharacterized hydantoinase/oxoprolinase family protein